MTIKNNMSEQMEEMYLKEAENWLSNHGCSRDAAREWHRKTLELLEVLSVEKSNE